MMEQVISNLMDTPSGLPRQSRALFMADKLIS